MNNTLLWLRAETKPYEQRTLVTPNVARELLAAGFDVVVERSAARIIADADYEQAGCRMVEQGSWRNSPEHAIVLGLKELDAGLGPFTRRHVHFAHVYKGQAGWRDTLQAFSQGGGTLYDLEFLVDDRGRRVAAFGYWAGYVGAALAVLAYVGQILGRRPLLDPLQAWPDRQSLVAYVVEQLALAEAHAITEIRSSATAGTRMKPRCLVIGALGRCGRGACELLSACDLAVTPWDLAETAPGGPFDAVLEHELLINCVFVDSPNPPFTTLPHLNNAARRLTVISDVSCDPSGEYNPLPVYSHCTTMDKPVARLIQPDDLMPALDLIAIDHLPSLLPRESSEDFSTQMLPYLSGLNQLDQGVWARAEKVYQQHLSRTRDDTAPAH